MAKGNSLQISNNASLVYGNIGRHLVVLCANQWDGGNQVGVIPALGSGRNGIINDG